MYITLTRVPKAPDAQAEPVIINSRHIIAIFPNPSFKDARCEIVTTVGQRLMVLEDINRLYELLDLHPTIKVDDPAAIALDRAALTRLDLEAAAMDRAKGEF